jgi:transposase
MSMARVVITAVVLEGRAKTAVARDYGVSRRWVQKLVARYLAEGEAAFEPRSRRPHTSPQRTSQAVEDAIVAWRKRLTEAGHDAGAETIAWHLRQQVGFSPSVATIWRVLSRRGFVTPQPHKRPRSSWHRFQADLPNELWQAGIIHWPPADGSDAEILNITGDHSRLLAGSTARAVFKAGDIVEDLHIAMARYGRPERMLTDNGAVFTGLYAAVAGSRSNASSPRSASPSATAALPPADLRQGRTLPPDPQKMARPPGPRHHHRRPAGPAGCLHRLPQQPAAPLGHRPPHPRRSLERPPPLGRLRRPGVVLPCAEVFALSKVAWL